LIEDFNIESSSLCGEFFYCLSIGDNTAGIKKLGAEMEIPARFKSNIL
jgi:hypothetical protein